MMELQNFEKSNFVIKEKFLNFLKEKKPITNKLKFSWSNWGFGIEPIEVSIKRLKKYNVKYIELHGNLYGQDLGYKPKILKKLLDDYGIEVSGICGMCSSECELSSKSPFIRQRSIDYFKRNIEFCNQMGGEYIILGPGAVGRPIKYDDFEFDRAVEAMQILGDYFVKNNVKAALEPVRADEVSLCHTFEDVVKMIKAVNHEGVKHICGDLYHILHGESNMGEVLINYKDYLVNLHMADTNRRALGSGMIDLDIVIMALYLIGYNNKKAFCSAEPLGPGADPYIQMYGRNNPEVLDKLVGDTASYFYKREELLLNQ
ncbi:MAG: sugar phosphate isomerase/epimerase [Actinobacteria bacterium]|nr:sugar phosphate isomerase/epimerase [Actinomycetota bacterium]